jgi:methyl-accepting chemotaxis protein
MALHTMNEAIGIVPYQETMKVERWQQKNHLKLGNIVPMGLGIIAFLNLLMSGISQHSMNRIQKSINLVETAQTVKINLRLLEKQLVDAETGQRGFLYTSDPKYLQPYDQAIVSLDDTFKELSKLTIDDSIQFKRLQVIENLTEKKLEEMAKTIQLKKNGQEAQVKALVTSDLGKTLMDKIRSELTEIEAAENQIIDERKAIANESHQQAQFISTGSGLAIFLLVCMMIWFVLRQVIQPIDRAALTISSSSAQIAATVEEHERIANQQAASVNQTTTTMDELGASSRQAAGQAEAAAQNVDRLLMLAIGSNTAENMMLQHEANLKEQSAQIAKQVLSLSEKLTQIDRIAGVVSQLANQTNMLALNAAVEAVRAGDRGKGFGVIATEIRKLADQSGKYAEQINGLTADIQNATEATVSVTKAGNKLVKKMVNSINEITLNIKQISLSTNQQAIAIQQSVEAMTSINQGAAETASGIAQTRTSTQQLNEAAQALKSLV